MKIYKLNEKALKKEKTKYTISGIVSIVVSCINAYFFIIGYNTSVASTVFFGVCGFTLLVSVSKLDRFYYELNGNVLTSYLRGRKFCDHDLTKVDVEIKENKKKSKITISENGKVKAIHRGNYVGVEAFDELINDVKLVLQKTK